MGTQLIDMGRRIAKWGACGALAAGLMTVPLEAPLGLSATAVAAVPQESRAKPPKVKQPKPKLVRVTVKNGHKSGSFQPGATIDLVANRAPRGKRFDHWLGPVLNRYLATTRLLVPSTATAATAVFVPQSTPIPQISVVVEGGGTGSGSYAPGTQVAIAAPPAPADQNFQLWQGDVAGVASVGSAATTLTVGDTPIRLRPTYIAIPKVGVSVIVEDGGSGTGAYPPGYTLLVTAPAPAPGMVFAGWTGDVGGLADRNAATTLLHLGDTTVRLKPTYAPAPVPAADLVNVTVTNGQGGGRYKPATVIKITANDPPAGQVFLRWTSADNVIVRPLDRQAAIYVPRQDVSVEAVYGDPDVRLDSHKDGDIISSQGETVFGRVARLGEFDSVQIETYGDKRQVDIDKDGRFAFRLFRESLQPGRSVLVWVQPIKDGKPVSKTVLNFPVGEKDGALVQTLGRVTFGATPSLVAELRNKTYSAYLLEQLNPDPNDPPEANIRNFYITPFWDQINRESGFAYEPIDGIRLAYATYSKWQLREVMVRFWENHFHTQTLASFNKAKQRDNDLYRQYAFGTFEELLSISANSAVMMAYLNNNLNRDDAINENYGREMLELHTVGVNGGYTRDDIRAVARIMAGRTTRAVTNTQYLTADNEFLFDPALHADNQVFRLPFLGDQGTIGPNPRAQGMKDGEALLRALAMHPSTRRFVCGKLVQHFVADQPPQNIVDTCDAAWAANNGRMRDILFAILTHPDATSAANQRAKLKTPFEYAVGILRNYPPVFGPVSTQLTALKAYRDIWISAGMNMVEYPVPTGFKEKAADWNTSGSLTARFRAATDKIAGPSWPVTYTAQNYASLLIDAPRPALTAEAGAAYLLGLGTADRYAKDEFNAVVDALKGSDGIFDPSVMSNGKSVEEAALRKAISLIITLPSYQLQ